MQREHYYRWACQWLGWRYLFKRPWFNRDFYLDGGSVTWRFGPVEIAKLIEWKKP